MLSASSRVLRLRSLVRTTSTEKRAPFRKLLSLIALLLLLGPLARAAIPASERNTLIELYNATNGSGWTDIGTPGWQIDIGSTFNHSYPGDDAFLDLFTTRGEPGDIAGKLREKYGACADRLAIYAPYEAPDAMWKEIIAALRA